MIEVYVVLWNTVITFSDWEGRVAGVEVSNEVVFHVLVTCSAVLQL